MPQNPLEMLRALAMRNVPRTAPSEQEQENRDFRAQAIQDEEPDGFRKLGRQLVDFTGGLLEDPFSDSESIQKSTTRRSPGTKGGALLAAAPFGIPKRPNLPVIAPEAYSDVKAGGLRLYSRLTDAFAKAPKQMHPQKARSVASQGASKEEIDLRKLEEFLSTRGPNDKIAREDIMGHLAANPLELDVVRKGAQPEGHLIQAQTAMDRFQHEMDTRYGAQPWTEMLTNTDVSGALSPEEYQQFNRLYGELARAPEPDIAGARYDWLQTPGPKENYGETLINLPAKPIEKSTGPYKAYIQEDINHENAGNFVSSHWDEPNNLVWSRHNDRRLSPQQQRNIHNEGVRQRHEADSETPWGREGIDAMRDAFEREGINVVHPDDIYGPKGRFIEEIQSDWHQQGRERGYLPAPPVDESMLPSNRKVERTFDDGWGVYDTETDKYLGGASDKDAALRMALDMPMVETMVPDAPFKDTYHELALKQQLLDAANDPELEWLGVADADTVSTMEGHPSVREGTELWYNQKHPSALEKLLNPLGGKVEKSTINDFKPHGVDVYEGNNEPHKLITYPDPQNSTTVHIASGMPGGSWEDAKDVADIIGSDRQKMIPGQGMWKANLPPELKELIKQRGFPAMAALLTLMQSMQPQDDNAEQR